MKTLNTLIAALLVIGSATLAKADDKRSEKNMNVAAAASIWESPEIEAPVSLKFLKAKSAFVPVAKFVWGDATEAPAEINMIPVAPFILSENNEQVPEGLAFVKAKNAFVPVAPFILGDAGTDAPELSFN